MKQLMIFLAAGFLGLSSFAADPTLKDHMKEVGEQFKVLALAIRAKNVGAAELEASEKLQSAAAEASMFYPQKAKTPADQAKYSLLMADLGRHALYMENDLEEVIAKNQSPQDLTQVTETFKAMNTIRQEGHDLFKEEE